MIVNNDLLDIMAEIQIGLTIPSCLINSPIYKYLTGYKSGNYQTPDMTAGRFAGIAVYDNEFIDIVCRSKAIARWAFNVLISHLVRDKNKKLHVGVARIVIAIDDRKLLQSFVVDKGRFIPMSVLYSYATINQLEWVWSITDNYHSVDEEFICIEVGRLDVMQFIDRKRPDIFDDILSTTELCYFAYLQEHIPRELAALEWLFDRIKMQYNERDVKELCQLPYCVEIHDDSIMQWMIKHHIEKIKVNCGYASTFMFIFQHLSKETIELFVEKISPETLMMHIGSGMASKIDYLHSINMIESRS